MSNHFLNSFRVSNTDKVIFNVKDKFNVRSLKISDKFGKNVDYEIFVNGEKLGKASGPWLFELGKAPETVKHILTESGSVEHLKCHKIQCEIRFKRKIEAAYLTIMNAKHGTIGKHSPLIKNGWDKPVYVTVGVKNLDQEGFIDQR